MTGVLIKRALRLLFAAIGFLATQLPHSVTLSDQSSFSDQSYHQLHTIIESNNFQIVSSFKFLLHFPNRWETTTSFRKHNSESNHVQTNVRSQGIESTNANHTFPPLSETATPSASESTISVTASVVTAVIGSFIILGLCAIAFSCHCLNPNSKFYIPKKTVDKLVPSFIQIARRSKRLSGLSEVEAYWRGQNSATSLILENGRNTLGFGINGESEQSLSSSGSSSGRPLSTGSNGTGISPLFGRGKVVTAPNRKSLSVHGGNTEGQGQMQPTARDSLNSQQALASARQGTGDISVTLTSGGDRHTERLSDVSSTNKIA